jgi:hypothetical protein
MYTAPMLSGSPVTTAWRVLRLRMEEKACRYGGWLRIYWISSRGQPTGGGPPAFGVGRGANNPPTVKPFNLLRIITKSLGPVPLAGFCECGDEPSGYGATELIYTVSCQDADLVGGSCFVCAAIVNRNNRLARTCCVTRSSWCWSYGHLGTKTKQSQHCKQLTNKQTTPKITFAKMAVPTTGLKWTLLSLQTK